MERATTDTAREVARDFYEVLLQEDAGTLGALARGPLIVDDPLFGRWDGDGFAERFDTCAQWLGSRSAAFTRDALTLSNERAVQEFTLYLAEDGRDVVVPVAVVAEPQDDGGMAVRVYHSTWPLTGTHHVRPPLMRCRGGTAVPDVVGAYQRALAEGDIAAVLACFAEDGYAREPAGGEWVYLGQERLREFYTALFSVGGGIPLWHCRVTDDGTRCAIEYVVDRWGEQIVPAQAGAAVYERDGHGKLAAARIYDDVQPPESADLSQ